MASYFIPKVWHAFQSLKETPDAENVPRSKLKVLNQNVGSVLQLNLVPSYDETFPEEHYKVSGVSFEEFESFLVCHVLTRLPNLSEEGDNKAAGGGSSTPDLERRVSRLHRSSKSTTANSGEDPDSAGSFLYCGAKTNCDWAKLDDVCWLLYKTHALPRAPSELTSQTLFLFWRLFHLYAKRVGSGVIGVPVAIDAGELEYWLGRLNDLMARGYIRRDTIPGLTPEILSFPEMIHRVVDFVRMLSITPGDIEAAVLELSDEALEGVIRKGYLCRGKKAYTRSQWKTVWCVLTSRYFTIFTDEEKTEKKGQISIKSSLTVEGSSLKGDRNTRFTLTADEPYYFEAADLRSRSFWIQDIHAAIGYQKEGISNWSVHEAAKRQQRREDIREKKKTEIETRNKELSDTMEEKRALEEEKNRLQCQLETQKHEMILQKQQEEEARQTYEQQLSTEQRRITELEEIRDRLQKALEEEAQARADEEIVRKMQANLLQEETEARQRLEKLSKDKEISLVGERSKAFEMETQLTQEKRNMANILTEKTQLNNRLEEVCRVSEEQKRTIANLQGELESHKEQIHQLKETLDAEGKKAAHMIKCLQSESTLMIDQHVHDNEELQEMNRQTKQENSRLKNELQDKSDSLDQSTQARKAVEGHIAILDKELISVKEQLAQANANIKQLNALLEQEKRERAEDLNKQKLAIEHEKSIVRDLTDQKESQDSLLFGEIDKRATIELEASNQRNRAQRLAREVDELKVKLQEALSRLALVKPNEGQNLTEDGSDSIEPPFINTLPRSSQPEVEFSNAGQSHQPEGQGHGSQHPQPSTPTAWASKIFGGNKKQ